MLGKTLESPLDCKEIQPVHPKGDQSWVFIGRTNVKAETPILSWSLLKFNTLLKLQYLLATWCEELTHLKRPWCWEGLRAGGEGDYRGWDGCMASLTQWTWVWVDSRSWWWTGRPGVLRFMGSQESDSIEWLNWTEEWRQCGNVASYITDIVIKYCDVRQDMSSLWDQLNCRVGIK